MPRTAAPAPRPNDNTKLMIIGGVVAAVILIMVVALASSGSSRRAQPVRQAQPVAKQRTSTHERMMNQRYGGEMGGKTVKEWMEENGETDFAKQRQAARKKR